MSHLSYHTEDIHCTTDLQLYQSHFNSNKYTAVSDTVATINKWQSDTDQEFKN